MPKYQVADILTSTINGLKEYYLVTRISSLKSGPDNFPYYELRHLSDWEHFSWYCHDADRDTKKVA